jgi:hypothetical protein
VAFELEITEYTVQFHRGHIRRKMRAPQAALTGFRRRLNVLKRLHSKSKEQGDSSDSYKLNNCIFL